MKRLILTTASVFALALGGAGMAAAAGSGQMSPGQMPPGHMSSGQMSPGQMSPGHMSSGQMSAQSDVKEAQQALKSEGLYKGEVDGILGRQTKQAISEYQKKEGLHQSATLDQQTRDHLMKSQGSGSSMPSGSPSTGSDQGGSGSSGGSSGSSGSSTTTQ